MFDLLKARLRQGARTLSFPQRSPEFPVRFRGLPVLQPRAGTPPFDVGACLISPEESGAGPAGTLGPRRRPRGVASSTDGSSV